MPILEVNGAHESRASLAESSYHLDGPCTPELARRSISDRAHDLRRAVARRETSGATGGSAR